MAASYPSVSPSPWRPTSRTLSALFAGSAVMFSVAVFQGGALLTAGEGAHAAAEPQAEAAAVADSVAVGATSFRAGQAGIAALPAAPQAAPGAPGAAADWSGALADLPIHRAPVRTAAQQATPPLTMAPKREARHDFAPRTGRSDQDNDGVLGGVLGHFVKSTGH